LTAGAVSKPRVTLGMPLYNAERYLAGAFDSLLAQDYSNFEIVVSDNASTDATFRICEEYAERDARIRLYRNERNMGAAYNYNRVVELARGELFKWVAYDDLCAPSYVGRCVRALDEAGSRAVLAYPQTVLIDADGAEIGPFHDGLDLRSPLPWKRVAGFARNWNLCNAVFGVIRTGVLRESGLIRPYPSSDVVLLTELLLWGEFHEVPERLFVRRIHEGSSRQAKRSLAEVVHWFDTSATSRRPVAPRLHLVMQTLTTIAASDLPPVAKARCASAYTGTWAIRRARVRGGQAKQRLAATLRSRVPESSHA